MGRKRIKSLWSKKTSSLERPQGVYQGLSFTPKPQARRFET